MNTKRGHTVLAALNHTPAVHGVLTVAMGIAEMVGADVEGLHVLEGNRGAPHGAERHQGGRRPSEPADRTGGRDDPRRVAGSGRGRSRHGDAGARRRSSTDGRYRPSGDRAGCPSPSCSCRPREIGSTAAPPRALSSPWTGAKPRRTAFLEFERRLRGDPRREVTVLLTFQSNGEMPPMLDRPTRDLPAWGRAFVARHCPGENRSFQASDGGPRKRGHRDRRGHRKRPHRPVVQGRLRMGARVGDPGGPGAALSYPSFSFPCPGPAGPWTRPAPWSSPYPSSAGWRCGSRHRQPPPVGHARR